MRIGGLNKEELTMVGGIASSMAPARNKDEFRNRIESDVYLSKTKYVGVKLFPRIGVTALDKKSDEWKELPEALQTTVDELERIKAKEPELLMRLYLQDMMFAFKWEKESWGGSVVLEIYSQMLDYLERHKDLALSEEVSAELEMQKHGFKLAELIQLARTWMARH